MRLFGYFRSTASWRVRIVLALKGINVEAVSIDMAQDAQLHRDFRARNPQAQLPVLEADGVNLTQSLAICEYLEERFPAPSLLPADLAERAYVRSICLAIAADLHPLNNRRVINYLGHPLGADHAATLAWYRHWVDMVLGSVEALVATRGRAGRFCLGDTPTLADAFLIPQLYNAIAFGCDVSALPMLMAIDANAAQLQAFTVARPDIQPDAVPLAGLYAGVSTTSSNSAAETDKA